MLQEIQDYKEHVIIYDDLCLVGFDGEVRYWFDKALESIRSEVTISIAARANIRFIFAKNKAKYFSISLSTLPYPEWNGLMRTYASSLDLETSPEDREYFINIITGFPPQVIYCVDLMKENDIEFVKSNAFMIADNISDNVTKLVEFAIGSEKNMDTSYSLFCQHMVLCLLLLFRKY